MSVHSSWNEFSIFFFLYIFLSWSYGWILLTSDISICFITKKSHRKMQCCLFYLYDFRSYSVCNIISRCFMFRIWLRNLKSLYHRTDWRIAGVGRAHQVQPPTYPSHYEHIHHKTAHGSEYVVCYFILVSTTLIYTIWYMLKRFLS